MKNYFKSGSTIIPFSAIWRVVKVEDSYVGNYGERIITMNKNEYKDYLNYLESQQNNNILLSEIIQKLDNIQELISIVRTRI